MMFRQVNNKVAITVHQLPAIPTQVDIDDLGDNGKLLTNADILSISADLARFEAESYPLPPPHRYTKRSFRGRSNYGIAYINQTPYAIYKGIKHNKQLGAGKFGRAKLAQNLITGEWIAYKIQVVGKHFSGTSTREIDIDREYRHMKDMQISRMEPHNNISYRKEERQYNFAMAFAYGAPLHHITVSPRYTRKKITFWLRLIIAALEATHQLHTTHRKIHRDLKPDNIIFNPENLLATLVDFGFTINMSAAEITTGKLAGAPLYTDYPQRDGFKKSLEKIQFVNSFSYHPKTDLFSLAICIANILKLHIDHQDVATFNPLDNYISKPGQPLFDNNSRVSDKTLLRHLAIYLEKMTDHTTGNRPTLTEAADYFKALLKQYHTTETKEKIITIHVNDIIALSEKWQQEFAHHLARDADIWKICLLDSTKRDTKIYLKLRRLFDNAELPVCSYVLTHQNKSTLITQAAETILKQESRTSADINVAHLPADYYLDLDINVDKFKALCDESPAPRHGCLLQ